jgi:hypothetical protein
MAIDQGTETVTTKKEDRCWRVEMFIDEDLTQQLVFHREIRAKDSTTNEVLARDRNTIPPTRRVTDEVKTKSYTSGGLTATGQQILGLVNKMADVERQVDIDNPAPPPGPPVAQTQAKTAPNAKAR